MIMRGILITILISVVSICKVFCQNKIIFDTTYSNGTYIHKSELYSDELKDSLCIKYKGYRVFNEVSKSISLGKNHINDFYGFTSDSVLGDINNNGIPDVVFTKSNGGNAGVESLQIVEFGSLDAMTIYRIQDKVKFKIIESESKLILSYLDNILAYWKTCGACSPYFQIFKSWSSSKGTFVYSEPLVDSLTYRYQGSSRSLSYFKENFHYVVSEILHRKEWCDAVNVEDGTISYSTSKLSDYWGIISLYLNSGLTEDAILFSKLAWNDNQKERILLLSAYLKEVKSSDDFDYLKLYNSDIDALLK